MQIHEITKRTLKEGILGNIGRGFASGLTGADIPQSQASIEKDAAAAAEKLRAQGYGQPRALPTVQDAVAGVQKNPQQQQFIKGLVTQWQQQAPKVQPAAATAQTVTTPAANKTTVSPTPTVTIGSVGLLTKGDDGYWYNEKGQPVTDPAQAAKIDKAFKDQEYRKAQTKMTAMVKEAFRTPQQTAALKAQRAAGRQPATATPVVDPTNSYQTAFEKWAAEKLLTREPSTRQIISLDDVKKTDIRDELDRALAQVVATAGDAQKNAVAVNNYLTIAVAGVTRKSQELKQAGNKGGSAGAVSVGTPGGAIMTQPELRDKLNQEAGINANQVEALKKIAQDPAARQALLKSLGVQA